MPMLASGHVLPFPVRFPHRHGFMLAGALELRIGVSASTGVVIDVVRRLMRVLSDLASRGLLTCDAAFADPPQLQMRSIDATASGEILCRLAVAGVDDRALIVLVNLLMARQTALHVAHLTLTLPAEPDAPQQTLVTGADQSSTFPPRLPRWPFALDESELEGNAMRVVISFDTAPSGPQRAALRSLIRTWLDAVRRGAYALAPWPPEDSNVETFDAQPEHIGTVAECAFHKLQADDACIDALLNGLARLHAGQASIREVAVF